MTSGQDLLWNLHASCVIRANGFKGGLKAYVYFRKRSYSAKEFFPIGVFLADFSGFMAHSRDILKGH